MMAQPSPKHVGGILTFYGPVVLIFTTRLIFLKNHVQGTRKFSIDLRTNGDHFPIQH